MGNPIPLASTEARLFRSTWQDGILDLLAGGAVLLIGLGWIAGLALGAVMATPLALALVLWPVLRQRITQPRLGQVRFNAQRRHRMRHGLIAVLSLGVLLCGFVAVRATKGEPSALLRWLSPGIPALILAALALSAAEALRLVRFVAYAAVFLAAALVVAALDVEPGWALAAGGVVVLASGTWRLAAFLRHFPRLPAEMDS